MGKDHKPNFIFFETNFVVSFTLMHLTQQRYIHILHFCAQVSVALKRMNTAQDLHTISATWTHFVLFSGSGIR